MSELAANTRRPGGLVIEEKDLPKLPIKYRTEATTPLKVTVEKTGPNELNFDLTTKE